MAPVYHPGLPVCRRGTAVAVPSLSALLPVAAVVGLTAAGAVGAGPAPRPPAQAQVVRIYQRDCATCHGADAAGTARGPTLQGRGRAAVDYMLTTGRMPIADPHDKLERNRPRYDKATIAALEDYIAGLAPGGRAVPTLPPAAEADVQKGATLYAAQCAACHSWSGEGGALSYREAPALVHATRTQVAEAVRLGPGTMPAFGHAALSDDDVAAVAAYVRYLDAPRDRGGLSLWHLGPLAEGGVAWVVGIGVLLVALRKTGSDE
jgi:ubiquinol-cytochrome c reductase cytochrome c subunit